jgi:hypothetical protein
MNKSDEISTRNCDSKWISQHTYDVRHTGSSGVTSYNVRCVRVASIRRVGEVICSSGVTYDVRCVGAASSIHRIGKARSSGTIYGIKCVEAASSIYDVRCVETYSSGE